MSNQYRRLIVLSIAILLLADAFLVATGYPPSQIEKTQIDLSESSREVVEDAIGQIRTWNQTRMIEFYTSSSSGLTLDSRRVRSIEPADLQATLILYNVSSGERRLHMYGNSAMWWSRYPPEQWIFGGYEGYFEGKYSFQYDDDNTIIDVRENSSAVVYTIGGETVGSSRSFDGNPDTQIVIAKSDPPTVSRIVVTQLDDPDSDNVVFTFRNMGNTTVERPNALPEITFTEVIWNFEELVENHVF